MVSYVRGKKIYVETKDSRYSSLIGAFHSAVKQFLETGDRTLLEPFTDRFVKDKEGKKYYFETNLKKIREIIEQREEPEFFEVYSP